MSESDVYRHQILRYKDGPRTERVTRLKVLVFVYFQLTVIQSDATIKSIELQLIRVETCGCAEGYAKEGSDISAYI